MSNQTNGQTNSLAESDLAASTLHYWKVAKCWNGRVGTLSTEDGMNLLNTVLGTTGPQRKVNFHAAVLLDDIICGGNDTAQGNTP